MKGRDLRAALLMPLLVPAAALAQGGADDEQMGRRLQEALRAQNGEVHRCYADALRKDPKAQGELLVQVEMAAAGKVGRVQVLKDQTDAPGLAACLTQSIARWSMPQLKAAPGDSVVFPLVFHPDLKDRLPRGQRAEVVIPADAALRPQVGDGKHIAPAIYLDAPGQPETRASLTLLKVAPGARVGLHRHDSTELLYVAAGRGWLHPSSGPASDSAAGDGVLLLPGVAHAIQASPSVPLELVQIFAPAGPEQSYLDRQPHGTENVKTRDRGPAPILKIVKGAAAPALPVAGGKAQVKILLDAAASASPLAASLEELTCEPGTEIPVHRHEGSDEVLYVLSGAGVMSAGDRADLKVGPGDVVRVPAGTAHGLRVSTRLVAVQCYTPSGPEQRFRPQGTPPP